MLISFHCCLKDYLVYVIQFQALVRCPFSKHDCMRFEIVAIARSTPQHPVMPLPSPRSFMSARPNPGLPQSLHDPPRLSRLLRSIRGCSPDAAPCRSELKGIVGKSSCVILIQFDGFCRHQPGSSDVRSLKISRPLLFSLLGIRCDAAFPLKCSCERQKLGERERKSDVIIGWSARRMCSCGDDMFCGGERFPYVSPPSRCTHACIRIRARTRTQYTRTCTRILAQHTCVRTHALMHACTHARSTPTHIHTHVMHAQYARTLTHARTHAPSGRFIACRAAGTVRRGPARSSSVRRQSQQPV